MIEIKTFPFIKVNLSNKSQGPVKPQLVDLLNKSMPGLTSGLEHVGTLRFKPYIKPKNLKISYSIRSSQSRFPSVSTLLRNSGEIIISTEEALMIQP